LSTSRYAVANAMSSLRYAYRCRFFHCQLLECHGCGMRCHHICRLYNKLTDKHIYCKKCVDELNIDVKANRVPSECKRTYCLSICTEPLKILFLLGDGLSALTRTKLGDFLEERVSRFLTGSGAPPVIVRVVCQMNKINQVAAGMRKRYPDYPAEFPYRLVSSLCVWAGKHYVLTMRIQA
jgi:hypothetical protein